mgnify:CR=1 FL=1
MRGAAADDCTQNVTYNYLQTSCETPTTSTPHYREQQQSACARQQGNCRGLGDHGRRKIRDAAASTMVRDVVAIERHSTVERNGSPTRDAGARVEGDALIGEDGADEGRPCPERCGTTNLPEDRSVRARARARVQHGNARRGRSGKCGANLKDE